MEDVCGGVPEQDSGDAAVGSGAGFEQACSEEGADYPGPEGLLFGGRLDLGGGVGHRSLQCIPSKVCQSLRTRDFRSGLRVWLGGL